MTDRMSDPETDVLLRRQDTVDPVRRILIATVTVRFDVEDLAAADDVAHEVFRDRSVLTLRIGHPGERSVYRVDVPVEARADAERRALEPARNAVEMLGCGLEVIKVVVSRDGLGDPDGSPVPAQLPWGPARNLGPPNS